MDDYREYRGNNAAFINPYNFVSVNLKNKSYDSEKRKNAEENGGKLSGVLTCRVTARTPLAVPDTAEVHLMGLNMKHKGYHFMRTPDGKPMIPGSSLRGVIRSAYETVTDSCFITSDETKSITYRTKDAFKAGLLYKNKSGDFQLFDAERYIFAVDSTVPVRIKRDGTPIYNYKAFKKDGVLHVKETDLAKYAYGQHVCFRPGNDGYTTQRGHHVGKYIVSIGKGTVKLRGMLDGYICIGEPFLNKKHFESVFYKKKEVLLKASPGGKNPLDKAVRDLQEIIKIYNDETVNINARGGGKFYQNRNYLSIENDTYLPVWYTINEVNNSVYLSVASIGRSAYKKTMGDMLGSHSRCTSRENACPACRLFGMVGDKSLGTRVRISDAVMEKAVPRCNEKQFVHLKELAGPKISYLPFYLRNTAASKESWSYDSSTVTLAGRKYYWHNTKVNAYLEENSRNQKGERNSSMELMGTGSSFRFEVYYNGLTETELDQLIWTLTLGENTEKGVFCHKIGHGKPIGLGSVKITVESGIGRTFEGGRYDVSPLKIEVKSEQSLKFDPDAVRALKQICDLKACNLPVTYPAVVDHSGSIYNDGNNDHASHKWFSTNYSLGKTPGRVLPAIGEQNSPNKALRYIEKGRDDYGRNSRGRGQGGYGQGRRRS